MDKEKGNLNVLKMANILRDHFPDRSSNMPAYCYICPSKATVYYFLKEISSKEGKYRSSYGSNADICMHAANLIIRKSQTTGSMIVELTKDKKILY